MALRSIKSSSLGLQETVEPERRPAAHQAAQFALYAARIAAVVGTYAAFAELLQIAPWLDPIAAPLFPPTGFAIGLLLVFGTQLWPGIVLGSYLAAAITGQTPIVCAFVAAGSLGAGLAGSHLVRTLTLGSKAFDTPLGVIKVVCFGLVAAAAIGAAVTAAGAALNDGDFVSYATVWPLWWLADAAASLLIAPLIITWGAETPSREVALEAAVAGGLAFAIEFIAFSPAADVYLAASDLVHTHRWLIAFVALMPLIGAALREDQRVSTTAVFALVLAAAWGTKVIAVLNEPLTDRLLAAARALGQRFVLDADPDRPASRCGATCIAASAPRASA